eukprot:CAMPEP_0204623118 /NCGR_PEP_ID=MMETSP0717-20131115/8841_1 /ASSEMBLY_ACC=CAM_ASM_000666 /TAXON_ID=230516 /ORGANISM="Chaetoceros curvisetus" /LENGTH=194 /DNA_ID=CAMNT_0051638071 /DNA_START=122 /DNA_END=706 /DNA_ORIENTATION=-
MVRSSEKSASITIETLTQKRFEEARKIETDFMTTNKGFCFGICPYIWCPPTKEDFEDIYNSSPDRCSTYGLAIREADQLVVGVITLRQGGQKSRWDEQMIHKPDSKELYVDHIAVTKEARGMGVGTKLLLWAEEKAKERGATKLSLGVVNGNPAKRLYDRFGFEDTKTDCFISSCFVGRPHGQLGAIFMEKQVH